MKIEQLELFMKTLGQQFEDWRSTPAGSWALDLFCRLACEAHGRGKRVGAKAIWERMRWDLVLAHDDGAGEFRLNNNFTAYAARVAMQRHTELKGYFETRTGHSNRPRRAIVVPIRGEIFPRVS